jgi:hypothetical protein
MDNSRSPDAMPGYIWPTALFFGAWQPENSYVSHVEKAPASWEAGDILQTRPAGLVV